MFESGLGVKAALRLCESGPDRPYLAPAVLANARPPSYDRAIFDAIVRPIRAARALRPLQAAN